MEGSEKGEERTDYDIEASLSGVLNKGDSNKRLTDIPAKTRCEHTWCINTAVCLSRNFNLSPHKDVKYKNLGVRTPRSSVHSTIFIALFALMQILLNSLTVGICRAFAGISLEIYVGVHIVDIYLLFYVYMRR